MKFNERLKSIREEKGLTQQQLSDRSGVSVRTIQNYESGSYSPRFGIVDKLAEALEISSPELLGQSGMLVAEAAWLDEETIIKKLPNVSPDEVEEIMKRKSAEDIDRFMGAEETEEEVV